MFAAELRVFGLTIPELAVLAVAVAYIISLIRDFRPVRVLRQENGELRAALKTASERIDAQDKEIETLKLEIRRLERATDLTVLQRDHAQISDSLAHVADVLASLDSSVKANTAAVEILSKHSIISEVISDREGRAT